MPSTIRGFKISLLPTMSFPRLPIDILRPIFIYLLDQKETLKTLCSVSHAFLSEAQCTLFQTVALDSQRTRSFMSTIGGRPTFTHAVRTLLIDASVIESHDALVLLGQLLQSLVNLRALDLEYRKSDEVELENEKSEPDSGNKTSPPLDYRNHVWLLQGCKFQLESFVSGFHHTNELASFLASQEKLRHWTSMCEVIPHTWLDLPSKFLPQVTSLRCSAAHLIDLKACLGTITHLYINSHKEEAEVFKEALDLIKKCCVGLVSFAVRRECATTLRYYSRMSHSKIVEAVAKAVPTVLCLSIFDPTELGEVSVDMNTFL